MIEVKKYLLLFLNFIVNIITYIPSALYAYVYSEWLTKATYRQIGQRHKNRKQIKNVLDVGTATGQPLHMIADSFPQARVLGIDCDPHYFPACKKLFQEHDNVQIKQMNFYDLEKQAVEPQFDLIIFGSTFTILSDQTKAIEIAKHKLSLNGSIYFLLILYEQKTMMNKIMEYVKPILKYIFTIDFEEVTYRSDFERFLEEHQFKLTFHQKCHGNFFLNLSKFYIYQVQKI